MFILQQFSTATAEYTNPISQTGRKQKKSVNCISEYQVFSSQNEQRFVLNSSSIKLWILHLKSNEKKNWGSGEHGRFLETDKISTEDLRVSGMSELLPMNLMK